MNIDFRTAVLTVLGIVGYSVWGFMAWYDSSLQADFLTLNKAMVAGTIGLVLRDMKPPV